MTSLPFGLLVTIVVFVLKFMEKDIGYIEKCSGIKITDEHKQILSCFSYVEGSYGARYDDIKCDTNLSLKEIKKIIRELREAGVVYHSVTFSLDDGRPNGSSHFLDDNYTFIMDQL